VNLISGNDRNWTPPPTQIVVPLKVAVVMSCAWAVGAKIAAPKAAAANIRIE
jgi:hypothetical protein